MKMNFARCSLGLLMALVSCGGRVAGPRDQWTVTITTDAPVPQFGDRLLVEVLNERGEAACGGCRRQLGVGDPGLWPVSFGIVAPPIGMVRIRVRLYRSAATGADGLPTGAALLDALGTLPKAEGDTPVTLNLGMNCFGIMSDVESRQTCDPQTGNSRSEPKLEADTPLRVGSWPEAQRTGCEVFPPGMSCIPGGVFLLGSPTFIAAGDASDPTPERLVRLRPFALDIDEWTVGEFRRRAGSFGERPVVRASDRKSKFGACTYVGETDSTNDDLPLNCVSFSLASAICASVGKRLPTEAEWEWAAGNTTAETRYPWGDEEGTCATALFGRGRTAFETDGFEIATCRTASDGSLLPWGPTIEGSYADITKNGVRNLGGNLAEWVDGGFDAFDAPCWKPAERLLIDPKCEASQTSNPKMHVLRGGHWAGPLHFSRAYQRNATLDGGAVPTIGVRCAK